MSRLSPEEFADKQATRLVNATDDMRKGVEKVTVSPTQKAAKNLGKLKANLIKAIDSGKMARRMNAVTVEEWRNKMINKGIPRVSAGIEAARPKVIAFATQFLPFLDGVKAKVDKMPNVTLEDSINRMVTQVRETSKFEKK